MAKEDRLGRRELRTYKKKRKAQTADKPNYKRIGKLGAKLIDRQNDSIKAGVDVDYESGTYSYEKGGSIIKAKVLRRCRKTK